MGSSTSIDNQFFDDWARKTHPSDFMIYLCLWRLSRGAGKAIVRISFNKLAAYTGLSATTVQAAIASLRKSGLIATRKLGPTIPRDYQVRRPWVKRAAPGKKGPDGKAMPHKPKDRT